MHILLPSTEEKVRMLGDMMSTLNLPMGNMVILDGSN